MVKQSALLLVMLFSLLRGEEFFLPDTQKQEVRQRYGEGALLRMEGLIRMMNKYHGVSDLEKLLRVNRFFNQVAYGTDPKVWGKKDYWASRSEFLNKGVGDCEDYSIAKFFTLTQLGVPGEKLYLTYVKSLRLKQAHMVLTYYDRKDAMPLVLDNLNPKILPASKRNDLVPVYSFNADTLYVAKQRGLGKYIPGGLEKNKMWLELLQKIRQKEQK